MTRLLRMSRAAAHAYVVARQGRARDAHSMALLVTRPALLLELDLLQAFLSGLLDCTST